MARQDGKYLDIAGRFQEIVRIIISRFRIDCPIFVIKRNKELFLQDKI